MVRHMLTHMLRLWTIALIQGLFRMYLGHKELDSVNAVMLVGHMHSLDASQNLWTAMQSLSLPALLHNQ